MESECIHSGRGLGLVRNIVRTIESVTVVLVLTHVPSSSNFNNAL